jgi:mannose-1-phosphate guanylyltransferase
MRKNTAPCIAYAAYKIIKKDPEAIMIVSPADHLVIDTDDFVQTLNAAVQFIEQHEHNALLTLGITPTRPETGYGYIQFDQDIKFAVNNKFVHKVKTFTEKPDRETAEIFLDSGEFLWNSGIFIWKAKTIINAIKQYLPEIANEFEKIMDSLDTNDEENAIKHVYSKIISISIDYGVMEKENNNVYVIPSNFGWSDLGTWGSLYENFPKDEDDNVKIGNNIITYETSGSFIHVPDDKLVVVLGLKNIIVAENDNMLLIANRDYEQEIRQIVNKIRIEKGEEYI